MLRGTFAVVFGAALLAIGAGIWVTLFFDIDSPIAISAVAVLVALAAALAVSSWLRGAATEPMRKLAREIEARSVELAATSDSLQREKALRARAEQALRLAERRKDEFLATLTHELRNPLAPMRNALYILRTAGGEGEAAANARAIIERQLHQLVRLVDDLADVSRISTGKLALRRERVELRSVARNALEAAEPLVHARGHALAVDMPPPGLYVNVDPTRLAQVFFNLLSNAAKFTDPGGHVEFAVSVQGGELVARVRDNGIGIAAEMREAIFDMFAQADPSLERSATGLGVGLSLARKLVELHGGTVEVQSAGPGTGAEFVARIPVSVPAVARGAGQRILLADDNRDFAVSLGQVLRHMGNDVRIEHDGAAALAAAADFAPEVAFLDIGLPKLNGFDLARRLRREHPSTVLVAVTGWGQERDRELASEAGFDHYLVKPIELDTLQGLLNSGSGS